MFITNLFKISGSCKHEHVSPEAESVYCPDCGKLIRNEWYITRCACCGVKLRTMSKNGSIVPQLKFCTNCGSEEYKVEKLERISFIDINFAVLIKKAVENENKTCSTTRCWQEKTAEIPKLPVQYL